MEFFIATDVVDFLIDAEVYYEFCPGDWITPAGETFEIIEWKLIDISYHTDISTSDAVEYINDMMEKQPSELTDQVYDCLLYTSPSPRDGLLSRMPSSA